MPTHQTAPCPLAADDSERWARLLDHARGVAAKVLRRPRSHPDVEDRAQDALVAFLASGLPRFDASLGTPEALLGTIVRNGALTHLRDGATRTRLRAQLANEIPLGQHRLAPPRRCGERPGARPLAPLPGSRRGPGAHRPDRRGDRRRGAPPGEELPGHERAGRPRPRGRPAGSAGARGGLALRRHEPSLPGPSPPHYWTICCPSERLSPGRRSSARRFWLQTASPVPVTSGSSLPNEMILRADPTPRSFR